MLMKLVWMLVWMLVRMLVLLVLVLIMMLMLMLMLVLVMLMLIRLLQRAAISLLLHCFSRSLVAAVTAPPCGYCNCSCCCFLCCNRRLLLFPCPLHLLRAQMRLSRSTHIDSTGMHEGCSSASTVHNVNT
jgi:hypothetical protein